MSLQLWVDDLRDPNDYVKGDWVWAKTSEEAFKHLSSNKFEVLSLDNDLGEEVEGKDIFNWIEERLYWNDIDLSKLKVIYVHSSNTNAVKYILNAKHIFWDRYKIRLTLINNEILK